MVIDNKKIYTSTFSRAARVYPDYRLVSVAAWAPLDWQGEYCRELSPSKYLSREWRKGELTPDEYIEQFESYLYTLDIDKMYNRLRGKILCCYEAPDVFCHRHIIMNWFLCELGEDVFGGEI